MFERIAEIIAEQFLVEPSAITPDTSFEDDLGANSIDIVELTMALEDEYPIGEMPEEDLATITTVGDLVQYIQSHMDEL